jgi:hypothetical protein
MRKEGQVYTNDKPAKRKAYKAIQVSAPENTLSN